jgi:hypothetical protein
MDQTATGSNWLRDIADVPHTSCMRPGHEGTAGELGALVGADRLGVAAELADLVEHAGDVLAAHAVVDADAHALAAEVV